MMQKRIQEILNENKIEAVLVSDGHNMRYISGFRGSTGFLYLSKARRVLMTDSRYTVQAREEAKEFEILEISNEYGYGELLKRLLEEEQIEILGFEDLHIIYADLMKFQETCQRAVWRPLGDRLNRLRIVKTQAELALLKKAQTIGDQAFTYVLGEIRPGITELEIAAKLDYFMKSRGALGNSFDTIVASGVNSAMPHAIPSEKKIESGDFVTMDFGCIYEGYCSDMTRTIVVGKAGKRQREIYDIVLQAQRAALDVIKAGMTGIQVDRAARDIIAEAGYGAYFRHALGHSVGLFIHEEPRLSPKGKEVLREDVVVTVEPGIYLPGFGGVRIEDLVVITENGCRNLTGSPKELIEL